MPPTRDQLSEDYDIQVAAFLGPLTATPRQVVQNMPGGALQRVAVVASPELTPDGIEGSDLTIYERAWTRAMYRYMRNTEAGIVFSLKLSWRQRTGFRRAWDPRARAAVLLPPGREVVVTIMPRGRAREAESYSVHPELRSQYR